MSVNLEGSLESAASTTEATEKGVNNSKEENNNHPEKDAATDDCGTANELKYACYVCNVTAPNNVVLQRHLNGKKHQASVKKTERQLRGESQQNYTCAYCSVTANSQKQLEAHMAGWKHKQQVFRSDPLNMNEITFQRIIGIGFIIVLVLVIFLCFLLLFKCYL